MCTVQIHTIKGKWYSVSNECSASEVKFMRENCKHSLFPFVTVATLISGTFS